MFVERLESHESEILRGLLWHVHAVASLSLPTGCGRPILCEGKHGQFPRRGSGPSLLS